MTMVQEATRIMRQMPEKKQKVVLDLLRIMNSNEERITVHPDNNTPFKRTGKAKFQLPEDFDSHFDDLNDEIADMFSGDNI